MSDATTKKFRLFGKASWGIAINVTASVLSGVSPPPTHASEITAGVWFACDDPSLLPDEVEGLRQGVKIMAPAIPPENVLIRVEQVTFNPCDYQPEGLAPAMALWVADALGLPPPQIASNFEGGRYVFQEIRSAV